jgi:hypothetical protein
MACSNFYSVRMLRARYAQYKETDDVPWTDSHIHYANMGGFPIQFANPDPDTSTREIPSVQDWPKNMRTPQIFQKSMQKDLERDRESRLGTRRIQYPRYQGSKRHGLSRGYLAEKGILNMKYNDWIRNLALLCGDMWVVDANQLLLAREFGIIDTLPCLSLDSLDDLDKGDALVKLLALLQMSWMFIPARCATELEATNEPAGDLYTVVCDLLVIYVRLVDWKAAECADGVCRQGCSTSVCGRGGIYC